MTAGLGTEWTDDAEWVATMQECAAAFRAVWAEHYDDDVIDGFGQEPIIFDPDQGGLVQPPTLVEGDARIEEMYHLFCSGSHERATALQNALSAAEYFASNGNESSLDTLQSQLDGSWSGSAKTAFSDHLGAMKQACLNMSEISDTARELANGYQQMIITFRGRIANLVSETQARLDLAATIEEQRDLLFQDTLRQIVGALGGGGGGGGRGGGAGLNLLGAAMAVGSVVQGHTYQDRILQLNGDNETQVLLSMLASGDQIIADAREAATAIAAGMHTLGMYVTDVRNGNNVVMPFEETRPARPELVTDGRFDPSEFRPDDTPDGVVDDVSRDDLVAEPPRDADEDVWAGNLPPDHEPPRVGFLPPLQPPTRDPYPEQ